ncbi:13801_t:CDS:2 [Funneliformis geosporum]|uniref:Ribosome biogenesis regulatory protein n=1 Tax=Funneliformis geosporum TaxID=1117311 RepID=A0A9W4SEY1_9GLOM|nr:13801_t:CDS:2 [Funneliformis geosporum]CAI2166569.1 18410_t:CDS:2 [Funneliformis geosporum]
MEDSTQKSKFKSVTVEKPIPLQYDLAILAGFDTNALDESRLKNDTDNYLEEYTRDGTQLIINQIFNLPIKSSELGVMAELPDLVTVLPREKPLPKPKPPTRWEKFAKVKGVQHRKKSKMAYDEATGEWVPRWGYKGTNDDGANDWLIPVPDNAAKKERITKNEARNRRNVEEAEIASNQSKGLNGVNERSLRRAELQKQIIVSKTATASMGKFDKRLEGEPKLKGVKRKFEPIIGDVKKEKESSLNILNKVVGKKGDIVNVRKAIAKRGQ